MSLHVRRARVLALLALLGAAACSDRSPGLTAPDASAPATALAVVPGIAIGIDSNPVTVARGTTASVNVRVARVAGFTGAVTLAVDTAGVARGVRVSIANATLAAGDTAARAVTIAVDSTATVAPTPTTVRISASGAGATTQTLLLGVVVGPAPTPGAFTLALAGTQAGSTVQAGQAGTVRVVVRRTGGFAGPVTVTADTLGLPAGVTVTQGAVVGDTVTLNLAVGQTATAGNYTVTLRGAGTGVTAQTLALPLTIQPVGAFTLAGPTTATTGAAGTTVSIPIRVLRAGGFGGRVAFTASGAPTGVTVAFDSTARTGTTDTTVTLRVTLPAAQATGTFPITVRAVTPGLGEQTTTVNVTVTAATTSFTLGALRDRPIVLAGTSNLIRLPITRVAGFPDSLTFATSGAPEGMAVSIGTALRTDSVVGVMLLADADVPAGVYPVTVTGRAAGGATQTTTINVEVVRNNPSFAYQFEAPTSPILVARGGTGVGTVSVVRISIFTGGAILNVTNVPRGMTVTLDRTYTTEGAVTVTVTASPDVLPGVYRFTLQGATLRGNVPPIDVPVQVTGTTATTAP